MSTHTDTLGGQRRSGLQKWHAAEGQDSPQASDEAFSIQVAPAGRTPGGQVPHGTHDEVAAGGRDFQDSLGGHGGSGVLGIRAAEGTRLPAGHCSFVAQWASACGDSFFRTASDVASPRPHSPSGADSLGGQIARGTHVRLAAEGHLFPQAKRAATPKQAPPAGTSSTLGGHQFRGSQMRLAAEGFSTRTAIVPSEPRANTPSGPYSLSGHTCGGAHRDTAAEGQFSPQANVVATLILAAPAGTLFTLGGQGGNGSQSTFAAEGSTSPQATLGPAPKLHAPAGSRTVPPATERSAPIGVAPEGRKTSRSQSTPVAQMIRAAADDSLGGQSTDALQAGTATEGPTSPQAKVDSTPNGESPARTKTSRGHFPSGTPTTSATGASSLPQPSGAGLPIGTRCGRTPSGQWNHDTHISHATGATQKGTADD